MLGPTTKPFHARDVTPKETPARTAYAIERRFSDATTENEDKIAPILGDEVLVSLSLPECLIALNQNMNPIDMNSITNASWSASAHVECETCAGMKAINHAAMTPVALPKLSLAIAAIGNTVKAPYTAGSPRIAYHTASSPSIGSRTIDVRAIDQVNKGGRGLTPPKG